MDAAPFLFRNVSHVFQEVDLSSRNPIYTKLFSYAALILYLYHVAGNLRRCVSLISEAVY